jgi:hypothetical protein
LTKGRSPIAANAPPAAICVTKSEQRTTSISATMRWLVTKSPSSPPSAAGGTESSVGIASDTKR